LEWQNLIYEKEDNVAIVTLNRPEVYNAIDERIMRELNELMNEVAVDAGIRALILTGGAGVFCAGADIGFAQNADPIEAMEFTALCNKAVNKMANLDIPVIAAIAKLALGGGCELALACDIRIASIGTRIGLPEVNLGIIPGTGGTQRMTRLVGEGWAKQLILTGEPIDAETALSMGLITKVVPAGSLMDEAKKMAAELAAKPPIALKMAKKSINYSGNVDLGSGLEYEQKSCSMLFATEDQKEGMRAFMEKRRPVYQGK